MATCIPAVVDSAKTAAKLRACHSPVKVSATAFISHRDTEAQSSNLHVIIGLRAFVPLCDLFVRSYQPLLAHRSCRICDLLSSCQRAKLFCPPTTRRADTNHHAAADVLTFGEACCRRLPRKTRQPCQPSDRAPRGKL